MDKHLPVRSTVVLLLQRASATMRAYCKDRVTHYFLQTFSEDISHCEKSGLNICYNSHQLYCTRFLEDDFFFNLVPSPPPSGRYLQNAIILFMIKTTMSSMPTAPWVTTQIFTMLCLTGTLGAISVQIIYPAQYAPGLPEPGFMKKKLQVPSALQNVSRVLTKMA